MDGLDDYSLDVFLSSNTYLYQHLKNNLSMLKSIFKTTAITAGFLFLVMSCKPHSTEVRKEDKKQLSIDFEKYTLDNGLQVILHQDKSDPVVAMAIQYGVGSNREKIGKTGFAHLFEHMLFQESENVGQDQFFKMIQDAGGTLNGGTWKDGTVYYEVVPKNAMELVMWLESDRMGYFINTVTESAFQNQQEVVQNEKRQRVDNNPYGHTSYVIDKNLYPKGHPYSWQVIGELEDLQNATVQDVHDFYDEFYGPNNATLVLAGDFEISEARKMIEKYFGEIKRRQHVEPMKPMRVTLSETKRLFHEDNFATAPQLTMTWPTLEQYTEDSYALNVLAAILSRGKKAPLFRVLVKDKELTSRTMAFNSSKELSGEFKIIITANAGVNLNDVEEAINESFRLLEEEGVTDTDLERIKAGLETDFYNGISSVLNKSFQLANYNVFTGDPGFITQDIENIKAVSKQDVMDAYEKYIKGKPFILTSFVPKGQTELIAKNSIRAEVVEEEITENVEVEVEDDVVEIAKTPSKIDRSKPPVSGESPKLNIPEIWTAELNNGLKVTGIEQDKLPLVSFSLTIKGGHLLDKIEKNGVANLITDIMMEGTATKTPEELEEEIALLGASIFMFTGTEGITIRGNTLARNFEKTMDLLKEILLEPRWDENELSRLKTRVINDIKRSEANPNAIANRVFSRILYGENSILGHSTAGTVESVSSISMEDLKNYYNENFSPSISSFQVVGQVSQDEVLKNLKDLENKWETKHVSLPQYSAPKPKNEAVLYFVDIPNAKQSVITIGNASLVRTDKDFYPAQVMNYKLGGSFSGNVNLILREEKGYTYGARTGFGGGNNFGRFTASSSVRTNTTGESVEIFREEITNYKNGISAEDLEFTKNALIKSNAGRFETFNSLLGMLQEINTYNLPLNYIEDEERIVNEMTLEKHKALANKYLDPSRMVYLVVGDAASQFDQFKEMGFDRVVLLDKNGNEVK